MRFRRLAGLYHAGRQVARLLRGCRGWRQCARALADALEYASCFVCVRTSLLTLTQQPLLITCTSAKAEISKNTKHKSSRPSHACEQRSTRLSQHHLMHPSSHPSGLAPARLYMRCAAKAAARAPTPPRTRLADTACAAESCTTGAPVGGWLGATEGLAVGALEGEELGTSVCTRRDERRVGQ